MYPQRTPLISHITQKTIKDIGDTAELTCSVLYAMDFPVLWIKVDTENATEAVILSSGSALIIKDSRFSVWQGIDRASYTFQVLSIYLLVFTCISFDEFFHSVSLKYTSNLRLVSLLF